MASRWRLGPGQALPDTLVEGTPEYREFREVMYERHLIRVHTHLGVYELSRPEPSRTGFTYESAEPVGGGRTATELPNPISFSSLTRIDVRKGHAGVGALAGFGVGFLAGHTFCKSGGLYGDCGNAGLAGLGVGGFFALYRLGVR